ncbi:hypothetical protein P175DRAFT_0549059 [Aspergillus ochraceoroseus IBT 24754]|uniref:Uncharacterized protein n=1 Tax=Aspergillus ochraceoroseus IBT 24754 TaxID=1392256 RepID=A0A2T5LS02_9EURO|nr:uncharacterized protein P175DRAFT_0549059 [Aspergillus ochraceoroseus IBT 24754]PTU19060.1 hypothetical protein P175DRAFT_0549059 [Aspergillus ochraceoroseus IBT 24754]
MGDEMGYLDEGSKGRFYLLLQVLWVSVTETWKQEVDKLLATFQSWTNYQQSFRNGPIREGTFALAKRDENFKSNVVFSPISNRTRSKMGSLEQKLREAQLETPTKLALSFSRACGDCIHQLIMYFPQASDWTLHRKSFKAEFKQASFEARTDGYLEDGGSSERVRALIEVKLMLRRKKQNPIRMQEAAQMVAWLKSDPDPTGILNLPGQ